jgi:uncharacterized damage-inducible protein DinB
MSAPMPGWIATLLARELEAFERELALCPDEAAVWRIAPGVTNSLGNLVLHVCGNLRHFVGHVLGGSAYVRDREAEFTRTAVPRAQLVDEIREAGAAVDQVLRRVTEEQLARPFPEAVGGLTIPTGLFVTHLAAHLAFHFGQAGYVRRIVTGDSRSAKPLPLKPLAG